MKLGLLITIFLSFVIPSLAQRSDTLTCSYDHSIHFADVLTPSLLITTGSAITGIDYLDRHINVPIQQWTQSDGHNRFEIENYFQYAPLAVVPMLKLCGVESRHNWRDLASLTGGAAILSFGFSQGFKHLIQEERPYGGVFNSFPSGHTMTAFMGAEILRREYGQNYPAIAVAGYAVATGVGCMRVYNNRHWAADVLAGAGFGILSASLMYWLAPYLRF